MEAYAIRAGTNSALEESRAEDRWYEKKVNDQEKLHDIKRRANERTFNEQKDKLQMEYETEEGLKIFIYKFVAYIYNERLRFDPKTHKPQGRTVNKIQT